MKVRCHTNLDLSSLEKWPSELPAVPNIGDIIVSAYEHRGEFQLQLEVVRVTWSPIIKDRAPTEWVPHIELHMTDWQKQLPAKRKDAETGSIVAFYEWYASLIGKQVSSFT